MGRGECRIKVWTLSTAWEATECFKNRSDITKCIHSFHKYSQRTHSVQSHVLRSGAGRWGRDAEFGKIQKQLRPCH